MAHLAHKLPWNTFASRIDFIRDRKDLTPRYTDLFIKPNSDQQVHQFLDAFCNAVREFAVTERSKYPASFEAPNNAPLFDSTLMDAALPYLKNQDLSRHGFWPMDVHDAEYMENWIRFAGEKPDSTYDNSFNEVVAFLLTENHMEPLLKLARNSKIRLDKLGQYGGNYQRPYMDTIVAALQAYVCLNIIFCKPELWSEGHKDHQTTRTFQMLLSDLQSDWAGDFIYLHPRKYCGYPSPGNFDPFDDLDRMRDYLKECFRLFVRYEMMEREAGRTPDWLEIYGDSIHPWGMHVSSLWNVGNELLRVRDERTQTS